MSDLGAIASRCLGGSVALFDVVSKSGRVQVSGLSALKAQSPVQILDSKNKVVARTKLGANGSFRASFKTPKGKKRSASYKARIGNSRSRALKLQRPNTVSSITASGKTVTIKGVVANKPKKAPKIEVRGGRGASACVNGGRKLKTSGKAKYSARSGRYSVKVSVPSNSNHLVLRTKAGSRYSTFFVK